MLRVTILREQRGWTRAELSRRAGMGAGDVGKIESQRLVPYDAQLKKLARALGITAANAHTLLDRVEERHASPAGS